jgi:hypothetical protein
MRIAIVALALAYGAAQALAMPTIDGEPHQLTLHSVVEDRLHAQ